MRTLGVFLSAVLAALVLPQAARAQSGSFQVLQLGHKVGTASYNFISTPEGYDSSSKVQVSMKGLEYKFSKTEKLSAADELRHVQLSATVNQSAVRVEAMPEGGQVVLRISANGKDTTAQVAAHPGAVFMPDFDPGALQTLLDLGVTRNSRDLWAIFPKQSGDQAATTAAVQLATYADQQGTLNGRQIVVHHLVATTAGTSTDLFSGPENQLLQAELPQQGFALIREGFVLTPPAKAGPAPAPPQPQQQ